MMFSISFVLIVVFLGILFGMALGWIARDIYEGWLQRSLKRAETAGTIAARQKRLQ